MRWIAIAAAAALTASLAAAGWVYRDARQQLLPFDDAARQLAPGQFAALGDGQVHYRWHGPEEGPVVVLVHGFSTPSFVWNGVVGPLADAGFRVLRYDNFGRGFSDRPRVVHTAALYERQLRELLAHQQVEDPIRLVGYSMGGAIAAHFSAHHPEKVERLALIAPAGFPIQAGAIARLVLAPIVGDWAMAVFGSRIMLQRIAEPGNQGRALPDLLERYALQMRYEGYLDSLLSTLRHYPMGDMEAEFARVSAQGIAVAAVWGDQDTVVPPGNARLLAQAIPSASLESIEGGAHSITYSEPEKVASFLLRFLKPADLPVVSH